MLIRKYTIAEFEERNIENRSLLAGYIRKSFDEALTSMEAESWITIAKEQGFNDMATEMESDLQTELLTA